MLCSSYHDYFSQMIRKWGVFVCAPTHVFGYVCVYAYMYVEVRGQPSGCTSGTQSTLFFNAGVSHCSPGSLGWSLSTRGLPDLAFSALGLQERVSCTDFLTWVLRASFPQVSTLPQPRGLIYQAASSQYFLLLSSFHILFE